MGERSAVRISVKGWADSQPCQHLDIETINLNQLRQTNLNWDTADVISSPSDLIYLKKIFLD